jgi:hypothetical protein
VLFGGRTPHKRQIDGQQPEHCCEGANTHLNIQQKERYGNQLQFAVSGVQ